MFPVKHGIIHYFDAAKGKVAFLDEKVKFPFMRDMMENGKQ